MRRYHNYYTVQQCDSNKIYINISTSNKYRYLLQIFMYGNLIANYKTCSAYFAKLILREHYKNTQNPIKNFPHLERGAQAK